MRRVLLPSALGLACAALGAACNAIFGIAPLELYESAETEPDGGTPEECFGTFDLAGCLCPTAGATQACHHGVPGPKSACDMAGVQHCLLDRDTPRWGPCEGGSMPEAGDACYDDKDNDCDGMIDQGCLCSAGVDLCKDPETGAELPPGGYDLYTIPKQPLANQPFQLFMVTALDLSSPAISVDGLCYGQGAPCPNVGAGCPDWHVLRLERTEQAGEHQVSLFVDDPGTPCWDDATNMSLMPAKTWLLTVN
jgi:hypothetical protein